MVFSGGGLDQRTDFRTTGKRQKINFGVGGERGARFLPKAGNDVERTFRKSRFDCKLCDPQRHQAGLLGRLDHCRIAHRKSRRHCSAEHLTRVVPRNDMSGHTERFV